MSALISVEHGDLVVRLADLGQGVLATVSDTLTGTSYEVCLSRSRWVLEVCQVAGEVAAVCGVPGLLVVEAVAHGMAELDCEAA